MAVKKNIKTLDTTTEEKIKNAARVVFHQKGYSATRTRDIAEEARINLALLNYYFRSKEKLFEIIMIETLYGFMQNMAIVFNDEDSSLDNKIELVAARYIDLICQEPEIPLFLMNEIRRDANGLLEKIPFKKLVMDSKFFKQHQQAVAEGKITEPNPFHFMMNLMGLIVFPFIAKPMIKSIGGVKDKDFDAMMQQRKELIPLWIKAIMTAK